MAYLVCEQSSYRHRSFLSSGEQKLIGAIVAAMPASITPLRLTKIGLAGAFVAVAALLGCRSSPLWLSLLPVGIFLNWFGMALDGPLALHRKAMHPKLGVVAQTSDLFSQVLIILAFGASPFLSLESAFIVLTCYLLFSAYNYIRTIAHRSQPMAYIGLGPTEFRILMVAWPFVAHAAGIDGTEREGFSRLDAAIAILAIVAVAGLASKALSDARQLASEEHDPTRRNTR